MHLFQGIASLFSVRTWAYVRAADSNQPVDELLRSLAAPLEEHLRQHTPGGSSLRREIHDRERQASEAAAKELSVPAILLVGKEPELFAEVDRLRAEGDLRLAAIPPSLALTILASVAGSTLWLLALIPLSLVLNQGVQKIDASRRTIVQAFERGDIGELRSIREFSEWLKTAEERLIQADGSQSRADTA